MILGVRVFMVFRVFRGKVDVVQASGGRRMRRG